MEGVSGVDPHLDALAERCRAVAIEASDLAGELRGYGERLEDEEGALEAVEIRLQALERVLRKHGGTIAHVLEYSATARARREELLGAEVALAQSSERLAGALEVFEGHVHALRQARISAAPQLTEAVCGQLSALAMPDATFEVALRERDPGPSGADGVELLDRPQPRRGSRSLARHRLRRRALARDAGFDERGPTRTPMWRSYSTRSMRALADIRHALWASACATSRRHDR